MIRNGTKRQRQSIILNIEISIQPREMPWKKLHEGKDPTRTEAQMSDRIEAWHKQHVCVWSLKFEVQTLQASKTK